LRGWGQFGCSHVIQQLETGHRAWPLQTSRACLELLTGSHRRLADRVFFEVKTWFSSLPAIRAWRQLSISTWSHRSTRPLLRRMRAFSSGCATRRRSGDIAWYTWPSLALNCACACVWGGGGDKALEKATHHQVTGKKRSSTALSNVCRAPCCPISQDLSTCVAPLPCERLRLGTPAPHIHLAITDRCNSETRLACVGLWSCVRSTAS
jgi:hypothetical protein